MNVSKLSPLGYEAKTEKGNTYKKSNTWAYALTVPTIALEASPYVFKNSLWASALSLGKSFSGYLASVPKKLKLPVEMLLSAAAIGMNFYFGHQIDKNNDKKRAQKADTAAEEASKVNSQA